MSALYIPAAIRPHRNADSDDNEVVASDWVVLFVLMVSLICCTGTVLASVMVVATFLLNLNKVPTYTNYFVFAALHGVYNKT